MPDEVDAATGYNEDFQAYVLEQQQRNREPANYTGTDCVDCGDEIPEERRKAQPGCRRCLSCQADFELLEDWRG
jgi:phage/conjugal plasmid C-4 type zinc finger TraR family protein